MKKFYTVVRGYHTGVFDREEDAIKETKGYFDSMYKGFDTRKEANEYLNAYKKCEVPKLYAVKVGFQPGIYYDREEAAKQVVGFENPVVRKYSVNCLELAQKFMESDYVPKKKKSKEEKKLEKERRFEKIKSTPLVFSKPYVCFLDCEANMEKVISIGAIIVDINNLTVIDSFYSTDKPKDFVKMDEYCEKITKLTTKEILSANDFMNVFEKFLMWLKKYDCSEICTWSTSDKKFLSRTIIDYELELPFYLEFFDIQTKISATFNKKSLGLGLAKELCGLTNHIEHYALSDAEDMFMVFKTWKEEKFNKEKVELVS